MNNYHSAMRLYAPTGKRLYLTPSERMRFAKVLVHTEHRVKALGMTLLCTGCRLSEALTLRIEDVQVSECIIAIRTLKRRRTGYVREIPVPICLIDQIQDLQQEHDVLFPISRTTAWRQIKSVMKQAHIVGAQATPKGLRHSYGALAALEGVPITLTQKWMGHADMRTTAIYSQIVGTEERSMATRLWNEDMISILNVAHRNP